MSQDQGNAISKSIVTVVTLLCATIILVVAIQQGLCDSDMIIIAIVLLFGGEQVAKMWIKGQVDAGNANAVPAFLMKWYDATEGLK